MTKSPRSALPSGEAELVCILQDRQFDAQNQLAYLGGGMMNQMQSFLGDQMLVNGKLPHDGTRYTGVPGPVAERIECENLQAALE